MGNNKVRKYRKPLNLNIGMIFFAVVFVYVLVCVVIYLRTGHIVRYEVQEGSLATNNVYRGIVLRDETLVYSQANGYVNFYAREGSRVAKNDLVYIIDETGRLSEELASLSMGENALEDGELNKFKDDIVDFVHGFDEHYYQTTYDFKNGLKNSVARLANMNLLNNIENLNSSGVNVIQYVHAPETGIVAYWSDGYEGLSPYDVTADMYNEENYTKQCMSGNSLLGVGDVAYKLSTNENWSIVIPIEAARGAQLLEEEYVMVRFLKNQYESWGKVSFLSNPDGNTYLQLTFTNSMITFLADRFLDVELIVEDETGLKIPVSSIVQKEFFLIPEEFVIPGGSTGGESVIRQRYNEDGTISSELLEIDVYNFDSTSKEYYVDSTILNVGDVLYKQDGQNVFSVSKRATLIGVYNMNKGYADFKQINILYQNDEYAIVKSNTKYGLNVYDYIVLNAESVRDDQFINKK